MVLCYRFSQCSAVLLSFCRKCVLKVQGMYGARSANFAAVHIFIVVMYGVIKC